MTTRRELLVALGAGALVPLASLAQQAAVRRIGVIAIRARSTKDEPEVFQDSLILGLRELGYVEGKNIAIEWRFADGKPDRVAGFAAELVRLNPELIVCHSTPAAKTLQAATRTIPIVMGSAADPVGSGLVASLARPGGNMTGLSVISVDISPKQIELLRAFVPGLSRIGFLLNPDNISTVAVSKAINAAARSAAVQIVAIEARTPEEIERGFARVSQERLRGVIVAADAVFVTARRQIGALALKAGVASIFQFREHLLAGGLVSYGQDLAHTYRRAATYVDKILKGAKPGDIPIEQPSKIHFAINQKTAKALGLTISKELLIRADEVIE